MMFNSFRSWLARLLRKSLIQSAAKTGASAYAGPAGAKAVEIVGPKVIERVDPDA